MKVLFNCGRALIILLWLGVFAAAMMLNGLKLCAPLKDSHWYINCKDKSGQMSYELIDFSQFYQAGQLALSPESHKVYDPLVQSAWAARFIAPRSPGKLFYNQSVPFLYPLLVPFGFLPYGQAYILWCLATQALMLFALYLLARKAGYLRGWSLFFFLTGVAMSLPFYLTTWHGQSTFLLTAAFAFFALCLMQKQNVAAGFWLALTTFKPQYLVLFVALAGSLRRFSVIGSLLITETLLMAAAAAFIGPENILHYPQVLLGAESSADVVGVNPQVMVSVRGLLSAVMPHGLAMKVTLGLLLVSTIPLVIVFQKALKRTEHCCRWLIASTVALSLVLSPHSHYFDCLLLSVAAALTLTPAKITTLPHRLWCIVLILYPIISWPFNYCFSRELEGGLFFALNLLLTGLAFWQLYLTTTAGGLSPELN